MNERELSKQVKQEAVELGFMACGISRAEALTGEKEHLKSWLDAGMNGEMGYMARNIEKRLDPRLIFEGARSVISVLLNYYPSQRQTDAEAPVLSKYAYGRDYHFVIKEKLGVLLQYIQTLVPCNGRAFTDSAPVMDKAWAVRSGLGWIGKNTNLISVEHGSFFFIGELVLDIDLEPDEKMVRNHCGTCTRCIDACPTDAITGAYRVDARKCISYQTIELKGEQDEGLKGKFHNRVFGCDICQDVCPWNLKSEPHREVQFDPHPKLMGLSRKEWYGMDQPLFNELFRDSAVKRAKFSGMRRNLHFIADESTPDAALS